MDSDEEDVLYALQNDSGRERETLIGKGRKNLDDVFQDNTKKLRQTLCFCAAFLGLGLSIAVLGPTLPDIMAQVDVHDYFQIAFIFTGRGLGYLGGFVLGNAFYSSFNPQYLIALSLFLAAIAMGMVSVTKKLYVLVMMMSVVGFASGILRKGAKVVSLGIGKTQASGFFRLIYFAFAVGAFISTLLVIPFSTPGGTSTCVSIGTENTVKNQSSSTTNNTDRKRREVAIDVESWTTQLNESLSSLSKTTDKVNETSDIFIFTQELNEIMHRIIALVCNSSGSLDVSPFREMIETLENLDRENDTTDVDLPSASAHSFIVTVNEIRSTLARALSKVAEIETNTSLIFDKCQQRLFLRKVCHNYMADISSRVLEHVNGTLEIVLPATNLDKNLKQKLTILKSSLEEIVSLTNTNLSNCGCNGTVFQSFNNTVNNVIQSFETLLQSNKQGGLMETYFREVLSQIKGHQTEIGILSPICRDTTHLYCNPNISRAKTLQNVSRILYENQNDAWLFTCNMSVTSVPRNVGVTPVNPFVTIKSNCFNLSVSDVEHLNSRENVKILCLKATDFRRTFTIMVAAETALTNITETLKHGQKVIDSIWEKIKSILKTHNFAHEKICTFGLQFSLVLNISRLNYCVTTGRLTGDISQNINSLMHSLDTTINNMTDVIAKVTYPLTEFDVARLSNITENQNVFATNLSDVAAILRNDNSISYYDKVFKHFCVERIDKSVEEIKLNSKNIKRIALICVKESPTSTPPFLSIQPLLSTQPVLSTPLLLSTQPLLYTPTLLPTQPLSSAEPLLSTMASSPTSNRLVSPKFTEVTNTVYVIIAVYLGLASLLFFVLVQIPTLPRKTPTEELSGELKIEQTVVVFFFPLLYTAAEVSFGAFVLVSYRSTFADCSFVPVVLFWGSFVLGRGISLFLRVVISLTQYLVFSLAGNIVASVILVFSPSYGTYMFLLGTVVFALSTSTLFHTGNKWLKAHISGRYTSNTFKYLFVAGDALGGGVGPLLVGYFIGDENTSVTTPLIYTISVTNILLLYLFAYAYSLTKGMNHPDPERGKGNQVENVVSTTLDRVSRYR